MYVKKLNVVKDIDESRLEEFKRLGFAPVGEVPAERIPCPHCDKTYITEDGLAKHVADKHPDGGDIDGDDLTVDEDGE